MPANGSRSRQISRVAGPNECALAPGPGPGPGPGGERTWAGAGSSEPL